MTLGLHLKYFTVTVFRIFYLWCINQPDTFRILFPVSRSSVNFKHILYINQISTPRRDWANSKQCSHTFGNEIRKTNAIIICCFSALLLDEVIFELSFEKLRKHICFDHKIHVKLNNDLILTQMKGKSTSLRLYRNKCFPLHIWKLNKYWTKVNWSCRW